MTRTLQIRGPMLSLIGLGVVAALVGGATVAFYGDVERSTGNTFTAGGVELHVDSVSHYNNMVCTEVDENTYQWQPEAGFDPSSDHFPQAGTDCDGTWGETDLVDGVHKFFNFLDLKPGDQGEDTISLHVYDNPAWGQFLVENVVDQDVTCTDPEQQAEDGACADDADGEIDNYLTFTAWLDQGAIPGFQCGAQGPDNAQCDTDPTEGDNIFQDTEVVFWDGVKAGDLGPFDLAPLLSSAYDSYGCADDGAVDGNTDYDVCHGYAADGRMVPSVTYYFGLAWDLPLDETGNDAQTDTYQADMVFRVEQHRNNPNPFAGSTVVPVPTMTLDVAPLTLTATTGEKVNFVASLSGDLPDFPNRTIAVSDNGGGGDFFLGTTAGECNSTTVDTDNEFDINLNRGICYQNSVQGVYTVSVSALDGPGGSVVGTPVDVSVTVDNSTI